MLRRRKRGRDIIAGVPSRFVAEMKLHERRGGGDPREKLKALRAAAASGRGAQNGRRRASSGTPAAVAGPASRDAA